MALPSLEPGRAVSEGPRIRVDRSRPVCPYCRAAVEGGDVWLCPGCYAPHHAECQDEHAGCAACSHPPTSGSLVQTTQAAWRAPDLITPSDVERLGRVSRRLLFVGLLGASAALQALVILLLLHSLRGGP